MSAELGLIPQPCRLREVEESGVAGIGIDCCGPAAESTDALAVPRLDGLSGGERGEKRGWEGRRRPGWPSRPRHGDIDRGLVAL